MRRFKNILYVVEPDLNNQVSFAHAATLANNNQACLTVVQIIDKIPFVFNTKGHLFSTEFILQKLTKEFQQILLSLTAPLEQKIAVKTKILNGITYLEIIREILRNKHDLVIKTAQNGELLDRVFGSDDMHLLRKCPCPIWLVKPKSPKKCKRILAAVDVEDGSSLEDTIKKNLFNIQILEMASSLAITEFAELHIVNAWETIGEGILRSAAIEIQKEVIISYIEEVKQQHQNKLNELLNEIKKRLEKNTPDRLNPQVHLLQGSPRKIIPSLAQKTKTDLVVMGTVARTGITGFFMGNTAETILNQLNCSILAIKPPGFKTPVTLSD